MAVYKVSKDRETKDGRKYFFRIKYTDFTGKTKDYSSPLFLTKKEAEHEEAKYRIEINKKEITTLSVTFEQAYLEFRNKLSKEVKLQSVLKIDKYWKHFDYLNNKKINDFKMNDLTNLMNKLEKEDLSVAYKNKLLGTFKRIVNYSNLYNNTSKEFLKYMTNFKEINKQKKEMDFYTYDEYKKFISVVDEFEYKVFFEVLYFMGLRQGELQALNWTDIRGKELNVSKTLTTKIKGQEWTISTPKTANSNRTLPIPSNVYNDLMILKNNAKQYSNFEDNWFVFGNTIPFKETTIQKKKNKYCKLAELKQIRIHDFRHSCASLLINQGATITLVSKYLGHSKVSITLDVYSHFYKNELDQISEMLGKL